jgi:hypothetical protein
MIIYNHDRYSQAELVAKIPYLYIKHQHSSDISFLKAYLMANPIKHFVLTPEQSQEKALIVEQMRANPHGPWVNGKLTRLPKLKRKATGNKRKD